MRELNLDEEEIDVLVLTIKDKQYKIPLISQLPYSEAVKLKKIKGDDAASEWALSYLERYVPKDIAEALPSKQLNKVLTALNDVSNAEMGES